MAVKFALTRILPSLLLFIGLLGSAVLIDYLFHVMKWAWVGRYCGFLGTLLILVSFLYSFRKRNLMQVGSPKALLKGHEVLGLSLIHI